MWALHHELVLFQQSRNCFRYVPDNEIRGDILGWTTSLVEGQIILLVQMERKTRDIFRYYSLYQIQPVKLRIQQSVLNRGNWEVNVIIKVSPLVQWVPNWNIFLCHQRTNTSDGSDGKNHAIYFQVFFNLPNPTSTSQDTTIIIKQREIWGRSVWSTYRYNLWIV